MRDHIHQVQFLYLQFIIFNGRADTFSAFNKFGGFSGEQLYGCSPR